MSGAGLGVCSGAEVDGGGGAAVVGSLDPKGCCSWAIAGEAVATSIQAANPAQRDVIRPPPDPAPTRLLAPTKVNER